MFFFFFPAKDIWLLFLNTFNILCKCFLSICYQEKNSITVRYFLNEKENINFIQISLLSLHAFLKAKISNTDEKFYLFDSFHSFAP